MESSILVYVLIAINFLFSYKGFTNQTFFNKYKFEISPIVIGKDYKRLITSGFLHVNWIHLIFNMVGLYSFSGIIEASLGIIPFLIIEFIHIKQLILNQPYKF